VRTLAVKDLQKPKGDWPALALGAVEGVELFWDNPSPQKPAEPLLSARGDIRVQVSDTSVQTTATLQLQSERRRVAEWKLQTPAGADVTLAGASADAGLSVAAASEDKS